jgi:hypothetical protein
VSAEARPVTPATAQPTIVRRNKGIPLIRPSYIASAGTTSTRAGRPGPQRPIPLFSQSTARSPARACYRLAFRLARPANAFRTSWSERWRSHTCAYAGLQFLSLSFQRRPRAPRRGRNRATVTSAAQYCAGIGKRKVHQSRRR